MIILENKAEMFKGVLEGYILEIISRRGIYGYEITREILGDDIEGFCAALAGEEVAKSFRDKWHASKRSRRIIKLFIRKFKNIYLRPDLLS